MERRSAHGGADKAPVSDPYSVGADLRVCPRSGLCATTGADTQVRPYFDVAGKTAAMRTMRQKKRPILSKGAREERIKMKAPAIAISPIPHPGRSARR